MYGRTEARKFPAISTPFGSPVEPDVYRMTAASLRLQGSTTDRAKQIGDLIAPALELPVGRDCEFAICRYRVQCHLVLGRMSVDDGPSHIDRLAVVPSQFSDHGLPTETLSGILVLCSAHLFRLPRPRTCSAAGTRGMLPAQFHRAGCLALHGI